MKRADIAEAHDVLVRLLASIDAGELTCGPASRAALVGAITALDAVREPAQAHRTQH